MDAADRGPDGAGRSRTGPSPGGAGLGGAMFAAHAPSRPGAALLRLLQRPAAPAKLQGIEAARGIAALMVVMVHAMAMLSGPADYGVRIWGGLPQFGRAGVDFFFVLSGFIISYVHARDVGRPEAFGSFWMKRFRRIYPTYWVILALWGALLAISPTPTLEERDPWRVLSSVLLLPTFDEPILGVAWSLRHELVFYAVFSLAILDRRIGLLTLGAWFAAILFNIGWALVAGAPAFDGVLGLLVLRVFNIEFVFGIAVAWLVRSRAPWRPRAMLVLGVAVFLLNGLAESFLPPVQHEWPVRHLFYALGAGMTIYGLATLDRARAIRAPRLLLELGASSYTLYLIHPMVLVLVQQVFRKARPWVVPPIEVAYLVLIVSSVVVAVVFSRLIEQRLLRIGTGGLEPRPTVRGGVE
jgi:exopolysaccharide production protein ExoZ